MAMSSRLVRCANGHMFNTSKHGNICPFCNSTVPTPGGPAVQPNPGIGLVNNNEIGKTVPVGLGDSSEQNTETVVGWLVCIEGVQYGQDYKIRNQKNFIGRSPDMHIAIVGDDSISRDRHAVIIYDRKKRSFVITPGDGTGLVYHNNELIFAPKELNSYDVIQMGRSKFIFVPLCGLHFEWDENDDKKD